ncbi:MAG: group II intron reverse transcriptase/maturase [Deltaproteobacteria bacterium]|nr:group II intron reverse transcriptase/maturase [Deltaproteobacteria bacterium]MBW2151298.1 group II intron reverse transcriptase/maturase [Deltaproteobacteria bacterium]
MERIRQAASRDKQLRFTTLWHHVYNTEQLRKAYFSLKRNAAPGVDGETWRHYSENLEANLQDLSSKLQRGAYRARPVRGAYIPKADGRQRPLGITVLEDKIVQRATVEVMEAIYEQDFVGFSYGFRPGRSAHDALNALYGAIMTRKVSWVLDADIRGYFDAIDHGWLMKFIEHRIADKRVVRHIKKWLNAGVLEQGAVTHKEGGVPQGGSVSPLLANVYLHYVFDLWADQWRSQHAEGDVIIVRFCDDFVVGFQYRRDAERFLADLRQRFLKFNLQLHKDKTRLIEFGRFAAANRKRHGKGKPQTFDFLGFTHICGKTENGKFMVLRHTIGKRMRAKLKELKIELKRRLHNPVPVVAEWLRVVLLGHYRYYGVPGNSRKLHSFYFQLGRMWHKALLRRSQRHRLNWKRMSRLINRWLPRPRICHSYPDLSLYVTTRGRSPVR